MCGENDYVDLTGAQKLGSTPHVRGKHFPTRYYACKMPENHSLSLWGE